MKSSKTISAVKFIFCLLMLLASFYFEYFIRLAPCALCVVQRVIVTCLLFISFVDLALNKNHRVKVYCTITGIAGCFVGIVLALRHVWMQLYPSSFVNATCLPDLSYMMKVFSISDIITAIIKHGGAECAKVQWSMLGISMPGWLVVSYAVLLGIHVYSFKANKAS
jgi:protein dithiol:quinone oxidoreductase